ncbi:ribulokinase [Agrococcus sp. SCSIO52902]|uniref:ribulokinase n=1 Tax=Agrococcus sp. SCSIO52902 TaxID=2933290 RepID=UPI001FF11E00|nr:ribulokinase [Agrococcus sp. SCSIO52902]UOW01303.1 ribulokinase [Agrococcus sp. SCSIO52902]
MSAASETSSSPAGIPAAAAAGDQHVIGIDFGTLSGRAIVVRVADGAELGTAVHEYANAVIDDRLPATGDRLPPEWALQEPNDWLEVLRRAVPAALHASGIDPATVIGVGTDFTASTPMPVTADGTPLCRVDGLAGRPHAYPKLWKHHAAQAQADRINALAEERGEPWLARYGGAISSEWEFAKALQILEEDPEVYARIDHWVEAADWIVWQLTGDYVRNACTAGYKGILQDGAYPSRDYLAALNPGFADFERKLDAHIGQLGERAGTLTDAAAALMGLPAGIAVAVGNVDAHVTAPAAKATAPGDMLAIMGTSTCHVMSSETLTEVPGMCGVVDGGIVAGQWGYEAGQSGVGDILAWYVANQVPPAIHDAARAAGRSVHEHLTELAWAEPVGAHGLIALDWHNGNRSVLVDANLSGLLVGTTIATRAEQVYRALVEATAFGTRVIVEAFAGAGVPVQRFFAAGGLLRNRHLMQTYADVLGMPISVIGSEQGPALGSAIHAAVAAGAYPDTVAAGEAMGNVVHDAYVPGPEAEPYDALYREYRELHDLFGRGGSDVMRRLKAIRRQALAGAQQPAAEVPA